MAKLNVKINSLELKNPIMTASGTFGYGLEYSDFVPLDQLGGIVVKGTTLYPQYGLLADPADGQQSALLLSPAVRLARAYRLECAGCIAADAYRRRSKYDKFPAYTSFREYILYRPS